MTALICKAEPEVSDKLSQLRLNREKLDEVIHAMVAARNGCTPNDVPSAAGYYSWAAGTRRMRELFADDGWTKNEAGQLSTLFNEELGIKVVVSNTDDGTGVEAGMPQNRSQKGAATDRAISRNQMFMGAIIDEARDSTSEYWYLCVYAEGDVVRAELSLPVELTNGYFTGFQQRIFLTGHGGSAAPVVTPVVTDGPSSDAEFDVPVTRKQAQ